MQETRQQPTHRLTAAGSRVPRPRTSRGAGQGARLALAACLALSSCTPGSDGPGATAGEPPPGPSTATLRADPSHVAACAPWIDIPGDPTAQPPLAPFRLESREVSNADFARFVQATEYVTEAEQLGNAAVFAYAGGEGVDGHWVLIDGADWRHPKGPGSGLVGLEQHPVVQVSWGDALAYADWLGRRLPTEAEFAHAARGGRADALYPFGPDVDPEGLLPANVWQGTFPIENAGLDGWIGTAPVASFPPNGYGLFDVGGNVWEWCGEPGVARQLGRAAVRGGSYLCARVAATGFVPCIGYRVDSRQVKPTDDANDNVGFRCAADLP